MNQKICWGEGCIASLGEIEHFRAGAQVFLVTGKRSFHDSGAAAAVFRCLKYTVLVHFSDFAVNPTYNDLLRGIALYREHKIDTVLAVGGGSVMDMAKMIALLAVQEGQPLDCLTGSAPILNHGVPVVVVPTTAGSGSEATGFAVVYVDGTKRSFDHPWLLPSLALIDPGLTRNIPAGLAAASAWDALAQAVESYWSIHSTTESQGLAADALLLAVRNLLPSVHKDSDSARWQMSLAAFFAGKAINVTRTTAPHAVSYALTSSFGIPHGHAVALTIPLFLRYNYEVDEETLLDLRGIDYVRTTIEAISAAFGCTTVTAAASRIKELLVQSGLAVSIADLGLDCQHVIDVVLASVDSERLRNNPRKVTPHALREILRQL